VGKLNCENVGKVIFHSQQAGRVFGLACDPAGILPECTDPSFLLGF